MATYTQNITTTIANDSVTNAKLANMAQGTIKMRAAGAGTGDPIDGTPDQASTVLDAATDPFIRTSAQIETSKGGNGAADAGKVQEFNTEGQIFGSVENSSTAAVRGQSTGTGYAGYFNGAKGSMTLNGGDAMVEVASSVFPMNVVQSGAGDIAHFEVLSGQGLEVKNDGGLNWTSATGAATTRTNIGFVDAVRATLLTGLSLASSAAVAATDTILAAFGKLQAFNDLFTTAGLAFARLTNPSAVRYPRINADNTVTALTIAQLYTDLAATGFVARTGSALAFDVNATYNSPTSPGSAVVTLDTSGAVAGVEVVAYFNHSTEPTWPAGITAVGTWYNSGLNVVRFVYIDASNISAVISNERPVSEWQIVRKTSATSRTGTTTLAADPTLVIPIAANQMVTIRGMIDLSAAAACDFKYRFTGPASPTAVRLKNIHGIDGGTAPSNTLVAGYNASDMVFAHTSAFNGSVNVNISIENGANAGTIAFEWAQNVSDASNATVRANSFLEYQYGA